MANIMPKYMNFLFIEYSISKLEVIFQRVQARIYRWYGALDVANRICPVLRSLLSVQRVLPNDFVIPDIHLNDISQMTAKFMENIPPFHRRGKCIPSAAVDGVIVAV